MAVYKHKHGKTYSFDFTIKDEAGNPQRFRGPTGETTERAALKHEAKVRAEAEADLANRPLIKTVRLPGMRLREAIGRYWTEKAQFEKSDCFGQLGKLVDLLGADTMLHQITADDLTRYQSSRRLDGVANRTINAEVPELMSRVFKRARLWKVDLGELGSYIDPTKPITWNTFKLALPKHRTRAASRREEALLLRNLRLDYRPIIRFALITGLRRSGFLLRKDQIDWDAGVIEYEKKSKHTGDRGWLPINDAMARILKREIALSPDDCPMVFTYKCQRGRHQRKKGERYAITETSLRNAMEKAVTAAGLKDWRMIHDLRHTAATNTLRASQNLGAVQIMLGHSDIGQTSRYAHVLMDDVKRAMDSRRR